jgi:DNA-binding XRE family transcriptional regulator
MMNDIEKYIAKRKQTDFEFAEDFDSGYTSFKIGVLLAQARIAAGMTQEDLAHRLNLHISTIDSIENHTEDVGLITLEKYAKALGKKLYVELK